MTFDVCTEFYVDGAWRDEYGGEDLSARVRRSDQIRITRGWADQQSSISPQSCAFTLNQRDGLFNSRNPASPLFGLFTRNIPVRTGVKDAAGTWDAYALFPMQADPFTASRTLDKASLDVTGDIDVRLDITPGSWRVRQIVAAKWNTTGNNRSWAVEILGDGQIRFTVSPDGTLTNAYSYNSGIYAVPENQGRLALRVTLDVNNGAGGRTADWYTSDSLDGSWTNVATLAVATTTSVFSGNASLEVGSGNGGGNTFTESVIYTGKIHRFQLRNGIGGTLVADFDPRDKQLEETTWADTCAAPNTWLIGVNHRLASDRIRFCGELASIPHKANSMGRDVWTPVTVNGILRRLSSNSAPLGSAIYRNYRLYPDVIGYWTMEDQGEATRAASVVATGQPGLLTQCGFGSADGLPGSAGALTLLNAPNASRAIFRTKTISSPITSIANIVFYIKLDALPGTYQTLMTATSGGRVRTFLFKVGPAGLNFIGLDVEGVTVFDVAGGGGSPLDQWIGVQLKTTQEGANFRFETSWHVVGSETFFTHTPGGTTYAGTMARFGTITFDTPDAAFSGAQISHVINSKGSLDFVSGRFRNASYAYTEEAAGERAQRLCEEESIAFEWFGDLAITDAMGPQSPGTLVENLTAVGDVDGGVMTESRDIRGIRYVTRNFLGNRRGLELSYTASHLAAPIDPVDDDRYTVNDVTVNRPSGSFARHVIEEGPLSVQDPPDGAGLYERSYSRNVAADEQLDAQAQRIAFLGTWDEMRVPNLVVGLHRTEITDDAALTDALIQADIGDPVTLTDLPTSVSPDNLFMLIYGYTEEIHGELWRWVSNTAPAGPYQAMLLDAEDYVPRLDATATVLDAGITTTATSLTLKTSTSLRAYRWINTVGYPAEFPAGGGPPLYIRVGGEKIEVTAITAGSASGGYWRQVATITRSLNNVIKAHDADAPVFLYQPTYLSM
jgi:hypothetical protein